MSGASSDPSLDKAKAIRKGEELDTAALEAYLLKELEGFSGIDELLQFPAGFSNLTYLIKSGNKEFVLRRPPFGANIKGGHDMGREFRVLNLLRPHFPFVPQAYLQEETGEIIGAPFYVMERVKGIILRQQPPADMNADADFFAALSRSCADKLAALHTIDIQATGLADFGKAEGYVQRQVDGWVKRYYKAETDKLDGMDRLADWMQKNIPALQRAAFIHNDYKYDNLVLDPADPSRIAAILDWEMATIGDPLMDLGTTLGYWIEASDPPALQLFGITARPGNLNRLDFAKRYEEKTGFDCSDLLFYYVFGNFKIGVICQQIYARFKKGLTSDPRFEMLIHVVRASAEKGSSALDSGTISSS